MQAPADIQIIGDELAIRWPDGSEQYLKHELLRAASPSAENKGEADLFGHVHGADPRTEFPSVRVVGWQLTGNYGMNIHFSDKHNSGIFSWDYLRGL